MLKQLLQAMREAPTTTRGPAVPLNPAASAAHRRFHDEVDVLNAEIKRLSDDVHARHRAAIVAAHPEIGERDFDINCTKDAYHIVSAADAAAPVAAGGIAQPDWAADMVRDIEAGKEPT